MYQTAVRGIGSVYYRLLYKGQKPVNMPLEPDWSTSFFSEQQFFQVCLYRLCERIQMITALQAAHQPSCGVRLGNRQHLPRENREIFRFQTKGTDGIKDMGIEAAAY